MGVGIWTKLGLRPRGTELLHCRDESRRGTSTQTLTLARPHLPGSLTVRSDLCSGSLIEQQTQVFSARRGIAPVAVNVGSMPSCFSMSGGSSGCGLHRATQQLRGACQPTLARRAVSSGTHAPVALSSTCASWPEHWPPALVGAVVDQLTSRSGGLMSVSLPPPSAGAASAQILMPGSSRTASQAGSPPGAATVCTRCSSMVARSIRVGSMGPAVCQRQSSAGWPSIYKVHGRCASTAHTKTLAHKLVSCCPKWMFHMSASASTTGLTTSCGRWVAQDQAPQLQ